MSSTNTQVHSFQKCTNCLIYLLSRASNCLNFSEFEAGQLLSNCLFFRDFEGGLLIKYVLIKKNWVYAPAAPRFFPKFWTFFNKLGHRENFETLPRGPRLLVLEWEQKPTFLTRILDKNANSGKTLHVTGPSSKLTFLPYEKQKFLIYWTLLCDQVYGQDTGSKMVNFSHFGHHFQ